MNRGNTGPRRLLALASGCAMLALAAIAAAAEAPPAEEPLAEGSERLQLTGTIQQIDHAARELTIVGDNDEVRTLTVGEQAERFDELRVGDEIRIDYEIGVTVSLVPVDENRPLSRADFAAFTERTGESEPPGGTAVSYTEVMATVDALDRDTRRVTLTGPHRTVTLIAHPDIDLDQVEKGDRVIAAVEEIVAVQVTRTKTPNPLWTDDPPR